MYRQLDAQKIVSTTEAIVNRIRERFPQAGLASVAKDLLDVSKDSIRTVKRLRRPMLGLRFLSFLLAAGMIVGLGYLARQLNVSLGTPHLAELFQGLESLVNDIIFAGVAIWFVFTMETRMKRRRALDLIAELRSLAHVIDMHQLNKDPDRVDPEYELTPSSPKPALTAAQLTRYLDYCSEMLSILGKLAALCVQDFDDPVTLAAVDELENLCSGLSRKVWQKIMILDRVTG